MKNVKIEFPVVPHLLFTNEPKRVTKKVQTLVKRLVRDLNIDSTLVNILDDGQYGWFYFELPQDVFTFKTLGPRLRELGFEVYAERENVSYSPTQTPWNEVVVGAHDVVFQFKHDKIQVALQASHRPV